MSRRPVSSNVADRPPVNSRNRWSASSWSLTIALFSLALSVFALYRQDVSARAEKRTILVSQLLVLQGETEAQLEYVIAERKRTEAEHSNLIAGERELNKYVADFYPDYELTIRGHLADERKLIDELVYGPSHRSTAELESLRARYLLYRQQGQWVSRNVLTRPTDPPTQ